MREETIEIRWHGRGGQGAITAAKIFAQAAFESGFPGVVMAPSFGTERRGAPVEVSLKISKTKINDLCPIEHPDVVVVLDDSILRDIDVAAGIKPGGVLVINTPKGRAAYHGNHVRLATADVTHLAEQAGLKRGIVNTGMIGALAKAVPIVPLSALLRAIEGEFNGKKGAENAEAARMTHAHTTTE
ncbi:MAG: ketoisovalerate oxidoreductase [Acidobacteria bacterium RBG_16_64_8]|nr:MAG: ketoisovalerate oxidoreductase [Acidobacteria bacterium RBG_16_64_8]